VNLLVTGGAGYIGSVLVRALVASGHHVTVLDTFRFGDLTLADLCISPMFDVVRGDARDESVLRPLIAKADGVIPLAALVGAPMCARDPIGAVSTNRDAISLASTLMSKSQWMLLPNTNSGYGVGEEGVFCTESSPLKPVSIYGRTKVEAEEIALARENSIAFRLATVFGMSPRMRIDLLVNDFVHRALTDRSVVIFEGHFKRNYIHVRDVASAFVFAISHFEAMRGEAYNLGLSDANLSKLELANIIKEQVPEFAIIEAPIGKDPDQRNYIVSNEKIEGRGFKPSVDIRSGIAELIKGYAMLVSNKYSNLI
jgi:nucleoside-diphosphate-sugar epimerase